MRFRLLAICHGRYTPLLKIPQRHRTKVSLLKILKRRILIRILRRIKPLHEEPYSTIPLLGKRVTTARVLLNGPTVVSRLRQRPLQPSLEDLSGSFFLRVL
ncbi:hypothetical protein HG531_004028 [Fusarium graminearum]|nr:hypothetical protein HG531_004028 [Fusarium graminearum]